MSLTFQKCNSLYLSSGLHDSRPYCCALFTRTFLFAFFNFYLTFNSWSFFKCMIWRVEGPKSSAACYLGIDLSIKRLMIVRVFSCSCDNVILPSFITFIGYQKETKSQVNPKETLS